MLLTRLLAPSQNLFRRDPHRLFGQPLSFPVTLDEILQKIQELSPEEREVLRRELDCPMAKPECEEASPETIAALNQERRSSRDERGMPLEDVIEKPTPNKDEA